MITSVLIICGPLDKELAWSQITSDQMTGLRIRIEQQVATGNTDAARTSAISAVQIAARSN